MTFIRHMPCQINIADTQDFETSYGRTIARRQSILIVEIYSTNDLLLLLILHGLQTTRPDDHLYR